MYLPNTYIYTQNLAGNFGPTVPVPNKGESGSQGDIKHAYNDDMCTVHLQSSSVPEHDIMVTNDELQLFRAVQSVSTP